MWNARTSNRKPSARFLTAYQQRELACPLTGDPRRVSEVRILFRDCLVPFDRRRDRLIWNYRTLEEGDARKDPDRLSGTSRLRMLGNIKKQIRFLLSEACALLRTFSTTWRDSRMTDFKLPQRDCDSFSGDVLHRKLSTKPACRPFTRAWLTA